MNTLNCSAGYFTDDILLYSVSMFCQQSVAAWLTVSIACCTLRLLLVVPHIVSIQRKTTHKATTNRAKRTKLSSRSLVRILAEVMCAVTQALFILLVSLNVASARNGLSPMLFGLCLLPVAASEAMDFRVIQRLAKRIIPFRSVGSPSSIVVTTTTTTTVKFRLEDLAKSDHMIRFGVVVSYVALLFSELSFLVFAPLYKNESWPFRAGLIYMGIYCVCMGLVAGWQLHRCLSAVQSLKVKDDSGIRAAIRKFKYLRGLCALYAIYTAAFIALVVCQVIPLYWYVLIVAFFAGELCMQAAFVFTTFARRSGGDSSSTHRAPSLLKSRTPIAAGGELERI